MNDLERQALEMMSGNEKELEQAAIKRLASLSPIDYDRARKQGAEKLGISVSTLDKAVKLLSEMKSTIPVFLMLNRGNIRQIRLNCSAIYQRPFTVSSCAIKKQRTRWHYGQA